MSWLDHTLVELIGLTLLHFLWQGALIGALYAASLPLTQAAEARSRYAIAVVTLAVLALSPLLTLAFLSMTTTASVSAAAALEPLQPAMHITAVTDAQSGAGSLLFWVVTAWSIGVAVLSLRLVLGWHYLRRLRRQADYQMAAPLTENLARLCQSLGIRSRVAVAVSRGIRSPVVIGWLKPLVLLPPAIVTGLPARQIDMILAHELAHIRRFDHLINLLQTAVETVLFYHPVVRWVSGRIRIERENACDDLAVAVTSDRLAYVEMLATLENIRYRGPRLALSMHDGQVLSRIRRLVEQSRPGQQLGLTVPILAATVMLAAAGGLHMLPEEILDEAVPPTETSLSPPGKQPETGDRLEASSAMLEGALEPAESLPAEPLVPPPGVEEILAAPLRPAGDQRAASAESAPETQATETVPSTAQPALPQATIERLPPLEELFGQTEPLQLARYEPPQAVLVDLPEVQPAAERLQPRISGGDLIERIEPDYPRQARLRGIDGRVMVDFVVTPQGQVSDLQVIEEQPRGQDFGEAAAEAIAQWRFEPYRQDGEVITHQQRLEIEFTAEQERSCRSELGSRIPRCNF